MSSEPKPEVVTSAAYHADTDDEYDFKTSSRSAMMDYDADTDEEDFAASPDTDQQKQSGSQDRDTSGSDSNEASSNDNDKGNGNPPTDSNENGDNNNSTMMVQNDVNCSNVRVAVTNQLISSETNVPESVSGGDPKESGSGVGTSEGKVATQSSSNDQKRCTYPYCKPCGDSAKCIVCDNDYHKPCKIKFEGLNPSTVEWDLCYNCHPTRRYDTERCASLYQSIRDWSVSLKAVLRLSTNNQVHVALSKIVNAWVEVNEELSNLDVLGAGTWTYESGCDAVEEVSPPTKEYVGQICSVILRELERIVPLFDGMDKNDTLNDIFIDMEGIFIGEGKYWKTPGEGVEDSAEKKKKKKTKKRKAINSVKNDDLKEDDDSEDGYQYKDITCSCCRRSMPPPFQPVQDKDGNSYCITFFRSTQYLVKSHNKWKSSRHRFVYCSPQSKSNTIVQWSNGFKIDLTKREGIGMQLISLAMKSFCLSYVNSVGHNECEMAFQALLQQMPSLIVEGEDGASSIKSSLLQQQFFTTFTTRIVPKAVTDQKPQEVWNNGYRPNRAKCTSQAKELLDGILTGWKRIVTNTIRRSVLQLRGESLLVCNLRVDRSCDKEFFPNTSQHVGGTSGEISGERLEDGLEDRLVLTNNVDLNVKGIAKILMKDLYQSPKKMLCEEIKKYCTTAKNWDDEDVKEVITGVDRMKNEIEKKAKEIARIIHCQWLDIRNFVEVKYSVTVTD